MTEPKVRENIMSKPVCCRCGGIPIIVKHTYYKLPPSYGVKCSNCEMQSFQFCKTEAEAVMVWNLAMSERTAKVTDTWKVAGSDELNAWCPECEHRITRGCSYCPTCGVRLDWGGNE